MSEAKFQRLSFQEELAAKFPGMHRSYSGIIDTTKDTFPYLRETSAEEASYKAFDEILRQKPPEVFRDAKLYDKKQPELLKELAIDKLFGHFFTQGRASNLRIRPLKEEVLIAPYSEGLLFDAAFATLEAPTHDGVIVATQGFNEKLRTRAAAYGVELIPAPSASSDSLKPDPEKLSQMLRELTKSGQLRGVLITQPAQAAAETYSLDELQELAMALTTVHTRIICDMSSAQFISKDKLIPLASILITQPSGELVSLYNRVLSITGTTRGYGASGIKGFGAACTGNGFWRYDIQSKLAVFSQRETTHEASQILTSTPGAFLRGNRLSMRAGQEDARKRITDLNKKLGHQCIRTIGEPMGVRLALLFDHAVLESANVRTDNDLQKLLYTQAGIIATPLTEMGVMQNNHGISANVVAPLTQRADYLYTTLSERRRKPIRTELFDRLAWLLTQLDMRTSSFCEYEAEANK